MLLLKILNYWVNILRNLDKRKYAAIWVFSYSWNEHGRRIQLFTKWSKHRNKNIWHGEYVFTIFLRTEFCGIDGVSEGSTKVPFVATVSFKVDRSAAITSAFLGDTLAETHLFLQAVNVSSGWEDTACYACLFIVRSEVVTLWVWRLKIMYKTALFLHNRGN